MNSMAVVFLAAVAWFALATAWAAEPGPTPKEREILQRITDDLRILSEDPAPVVCIVDTTHPDELDSSAKPSKELVKIRQMQSRMEELSGLRCLVLHYMQLKRADLSKPNVRAVVVRAWKALRDEFHKNELYAMLRESDAPIIGFCGGHHQIYMAHGGKPGNLRPLRADEKDPNPGYFPGTFKEWGPTKIRILKRDPLFEGFGDEMVMVEMHVAECKELPAEFDLLASSDECKAQVIKHKSRLVYGTQFHPEVYDDRSPDGRRLIRNFLGLARRHTDALHRAHLAQVFGEGNADAVREAHGAIEDLRSGYANSGAETYGADSLRADLQRIERTLGLLDKAPTAAVASQRKQLDAIRAVCRWRAEMGRVKGLTDCAAMAEAYNKAAAPDLADLGDRARIERAFIERGGDFGRDTKNLAVSVDLNATEWRHELRGWSERVDSPPLDNLAYRCVADGSREATIRFQLKPGACLLQVTGYSGSDGRGCGISLDGKRAGEFVGAKGSEGWTTRSVAVLLNPSEGDWHTLTFTPMPGRRLAMTKVALRRLRLAKSP